MFSMHACVPVGWPCPFLVLYGRETLVLCSTACALNMTGTSKELSISFQQTIALSHTDFI